MAIGSQNTGSSGGSPREVEETEADKIKKVKETIASTQALAKVVLQLAKKKSSIPPPMTEEELEEPKNEST